MVKDYPLILVCFNLERFSPECLYTYCKNVLCFYSQSFIMIMNENMRRLSSEYDVAYLSTSYYFSHLPFLLEAGRI